LWCERGRKKQNFRTGENFQRKKSGEEGFILMTKFYANTRALATMATIMLMLVSRPYA
jgi:hypothetical protein